MLREKWDQLLRNFLVNKAIWLFMFVNGLEIPETIEITKLLLFLNVIMDCDFYVEGCQCYYEKSGDLTFWSRLYGQSVWWQQASHNLFGSQRLHHQQLVPSTVVCGILVCCNWLTDIPWKQTTENEGKVGVVFTKDQPL